MAAQAMRVITVSNIKGGSTKSTLAIHLAEALSRRGKTLVVDMDMQADTTDFFLPHLPIEAIDRGNVYKLLVGESTLAMSLHKAGFCDMLPGTIELANLNAKVFGNISLLKKLDIFLKSMDYQYVIIDTPGSARAELTVSLACSDTVIIPVTPSKWAIRAVNILIDEIHNAQSIIGHAHKLAFVPSLFGVSQKHKDLLERLHSIPEIPCLSEIPRSETIKSRTEKHQTLKKASQAWEAFDKLADGVIGMQGLESRQF